MRRNKLALYLHLVWGTWDRLPLITDAVERRLHRCIEGIAQEQGCTVVTINGMPDHVHVLLTWPPTLSIADLVKMIKGTSSHFVNETLRPGEFFKWQGSYGAFTVSRWDLEQISDYIERQKAHHASGDLIAEYEASFEEVNDQQSA